MSKFFHSLGIGRYALQNLPEVHRAALQAGIYRRSFKIALVAGTLLNLVNQPAAWAGLVFPEPMGMPRLDLIKALLTYAVPFLVASHGALSALDSGAAEAAGEPPG